jgi:hypothetical protein
MKLIKNELRSVMKQERLDSLMMLGIHRERREKLDLDNVVDFPNAEFHFEFGSVFFWELLMVMDNNYTS